MTSKSCDTKTEDQWDALYRQGLGAPRYPNSYVVRWLFAHFPRRKAADFHLLDMGTGMGRHAMLMAKEGYHVTGTDVSATSLDQAKEWAKAEGLNISFRQASADHHPFPDHSFDGIVSYGVLYYLSFNKFNLAITEIHRLLKPGGSAFVMVKSDRDVRKTKGEMIAPHHYKITVKDETMPWHNEVGMALTLLPKSEIIKCFKEFSAMTIEEVTSTLEGGKYLESAWLVYVRK